VSKFVAAGVEYVTHDPVSLAVRRAGLAEKYGFDGFWIAEGYHWFRSTWNESRSSTTTACMAASATKSIKIGLNTLSPFTRIPAVIAMELRALIDVAPRRVILGVGPHKTAMIANGIAPESVNSVATIRETVLLTRKFLSGEEFEYTGSVFAARAPRQKSLPPVNLPVYLGVTGPKLIGLAAEVADGLILPTLVTPSFVGHASSLLRERCAAIGRQVKNINLGAVLICAVSRDMPYAMFHAKKVMATYLANKVQNIRDATLMQHLGLSATLASEISRLVSQGNLAKAASRISDEDVARARLVVGTPDESLEILQEFADAGMTMPILQICQCDDQLYSDSLKLLSSEVLPHLVDREDVRRQKWGL
jgi:5,10-methylenetetrahydromethanopterin reductase